MRFFTRFLLLCVGFCLFTYGLLRWSAEGFGIEGLLPFTSAYQTQGLHYLMLGLAMIPPSLWEIFNLERRAARTPDDGKRPPETASPTASSKASPRAYKSAAPPAEHAVRAPER